jgi:hypothetical protein
MKFFLIVFILLFFNRAESQTCMEIINNNSYKLYLNKIGLVTHNFNASHYRIIKFDPQQH